MKNILSFFLIVAFLALVYLYKDIVLDFFDLFFKKEPQKLENSVATLVEQKSNVRYKRSNQLIWNSAEDKMRFALLDSVSTEKDSLALISFDVGPVLNIQEKSLVVIELPEEINPIYEVTQLTMEEGILQLRNTKDNNVAIVKTGNLTTKAIGLASFGLKVKDKKADIWVDEGVAVVSDLDGTEETIHENEYRTFNTDKIEIKEEIPEPIKEPKKVRRKPRIMNIKAKRAKTLSSAQIRAIITQQRNRIDRCYQQKGVRNQRGSVTLKVQIEQSGKVSNLDITNSTINSPIV